MSAVLSRTVVAGGVVYPAGTPATPELEERITNPDHWSGKASSDPEGYDGWKVDALKAEIDSRNAGRDPEGDNYLSTEGKKADLVAVLEADDS